MVQQTPLCRGQRSQLIVELYKQHKCEHHRQRCREARPISNEHWENCSIIEDSPWNPHFKAMPLAYLLVLSAGDALQDILGRTPGSRVAICGSNPAEINCFSAG